MDTQALRSTLTSLAPQHHEDYLGFSGCPRGRSVCLHGADAHAPRCTIPRGRSQHGEQQGDPLHAAAGELGRDDAWGHRLRPARPLENRHRLQRGTAVRT